MKRWTLAVGPLVMRDLAGIEDYYRAVAPEQIARWRREFKATVRSIRQNPCLSREDRPNVRHRATHIFPYHVWYTLDEARQVVTIAAVLHQRRDPALAALRTIR
ncbi:MAG: type II toxin-antitoxin system RelE/ParE family toxin [Propionibacteriaceae bacterium]|jgi:plasmid stabilization system protein ParE|nr:type II toxin-antitoxin system RelE/ParE family toxin [Propionibacteriaceae bacterium]